MHTKTIALLISTLLALSLILELFAYLEIDINHNLIYFSGVARIGALILMAREGTTFKRRYLSIAISLVFVPIFIGSLFKIMHWPGANNMLFGGLVLLPIVYLMAFITKKGKRWLDILKCVWVLLFTSSTILTIGHYPYGEEIKNWEPLVFSILFFTFTFQVMQTKRQDSQ